MFRGIFFGGQPPFLFISIWVTNRAWICPDLMCLSCEGTAFDSIWEQSRRKRWLHFIIYTGWLNQDPCNDQSKLILLCHPQRITQTVQTVLFALLKLILPCSLQPLCSCSSSSICCFLYAIWGSYPPNLTKFVHFFDKTIHFSTFKNPMKKTVGWKVSLPYDVLVHLVERWRLSTLGIWCNIPLPEN